MCRSVCSAVGRRCSKLGKIEQFTHADEVTTAIRSRVLPAAAAIRRRHSRKNNAAVAGYSSALIVNTNAESHVVTSYDAIAEVLRLFENI